MPVGVTGLTLQAVDLRTVAINLRVLGLDGGPPPRIPMSEPSWRQGAHVAAGTRYQYRQKRFSLIVTALPQDATGKVTTSPEQHAEDNLEIIFGLLHSNDGSPLSLIKTLPSTLQKEALVYPGQGASVVRDQGPLKIATIPLVMAYPFWRGLPQETNAGLVTSFTLDNDGTAPVADMQILFNTAGNITHTESGDVITVTGDTNILVDLPSGKVTKAGVRSGAAKFSVGYGMELRKGTNNFTSTANLDIDYYHAYLT